MARTISTLLAAVALVLVWSGCGETGNELVFCDYVDAADAEQALKDRYEFDHVELQDMMIGTWYAQFPGSDASQAFAATVTVTHIQDSTAPISYGAPKRGDTVDLEADKFDECACVSAPVDVQIDCDLQDGSFRRTQVTVEGTSLSANVDTGSINDVPTGLVQVEHECEDAPGGALTFAYAFMPDGTLYISAEHQGYRFQQSGAKQ